MNVQMFDERQDNGRKASLMRRAVRLFNSEYVSREQNKANRIAWLRSVQMLGDRWLLAVPINKEQAS
jgi:hypothetical protein